jgi:hypothetical protein
MFERFTDRSRKVVAMANSEAVRRGYAMIDTEHVLWGLAVEGSGVGANVLKRLVGDISKVRVAIEQEMNPVVDPFAVARLPQTLGFKRVIEHAIEESCSMSHTYVGTEHILLGLMRKTDGKAAVVLQNLGITIEQTRQEILNILAVDAPLPAIIGPPSPAHIDYCGNTSAVGGPTLPHIVAGVFFGALFLATVSIVLFTLVSVFTMPPSGGPLTTGEATATVPFLLMCLGAAAVLLRMTIRQFRRRPIKPS